MHGAPASRVHTPDSTEVDCSPLHVKAEFEEFGVVRWIDSLEYWSCSVSFIGVHLQAKDLKHKRMFDILFVMIFGLSGRVLTKGKFFFNQFSFVFIFIFIFHVVQIRTLFHIPPKRKDEEQIGNARGCERVAFLSTSASLLFHHTFTEEIHACTNLFKFFIFYFFYSCLTARTAKEINCALNQMRYSDLCLFHDYGKPI